MNHNSMPPVAFTPIEDCAKRLTVEIASFGVKNLAVHDSFPKAELYLDCRGVTDPSLTPGAPVGNGDNPDVQEWVEFHNDISPYTQLTIRAMQRLVSRRGVGHEFDSPFRILTMCAHGIHRSRAMKHILAKILKHVWGFHSVVIK